MRQGYSEHVFCLVKQGRHSVNCRFAGTSGQLCAWRRLPVQRLAELHFPARLSPDHGFQPFGRISGFRRTLPRMDRRHPHLQSRRSRHLVKAARDFCVAPAFGGDGVAHRGSWSSSRRGPAAFPALPSPRVAGAGSPGPNGRGALELELPDARDLRTRRRTSGSAAASASLQPLR